MTKKRITYNKIKEDKKRYVYFIYKNDYESREDITDENVFYAVIENGIISNEQAWIELRKYMEWNYGITNVKKEYTLFSTDKDIFEGEF